MVLPTFLPYFFYVPFLVNSTCKVPFKKKKIPCPFSILDKNTILCKKKSSFLYIFHNVSFSFLYNFKGDTSNILGPLIFAAGRGQCIATCMCNTLRILVSISTHLFVQLSFLIRDIRASDKGHMPPILEIF
jgi:hypothetical protein